LGQRLAARLLRRHVRPLALDDAVADALAARDAEVGDLRTSPEVVSSRFDGEMSAWMIAPPGRLWANSSPAHAHCTT
jgi:hypothetical protein